MREMRVNTEPPERAPPRPLELFAQRLEARLDALELRGPPFVLFECELQLAQVSRHLVFLSTGLLQLGVHRVQVDAHVLELGAEICDALHLTVEQRTGVGMSLFLLRVLGVELVVLRKLGLPLVFRVASASVREAVTDERDARDH